MNTDEVARLLNACVARWEGECVEVGINAYGEIGRCSENHA